MAKKKSSRDRVVYSEFGLEAATDRPSQPDLPPNQQTLKIEASRKGRGGKTVTVISGFQQAAAVTQALAKQLKNHCGSGGTVKDGGIEIQGDHRAKVKAFLDNLGYRSKFSGG
ncbi:translation initiation factor [Lyngbya confervoides]|uniref:Translation initiation factor n=1 Tax=Lyngbya confervoides BDU141951 TaxID=1574623 RepID=A0ABD4T3B4_9CYAN|nr:translation initiation factor [Lyngbya confervoides]MCM1982810.1 translation initiation factor [Lyngbya confervoides BDU141951]